MEDGMAQALRVLTWNVEQLPPPLKKNGKGRARKACDLLLGLPARDRPDVITLNEVFYGEARNVFEQRLRPHYPHFEHIGKSAVFLHSGLLVFSKRPFHKLSNGLKQYFRSYTSSADEDRFANKGIALVRVDGPGGPTTIALTHMQSGPNRRSVRKSQFRQINNAIRFISAPGVQRNNTVLTGDLNVYGHINGPGSEVASVFADIPNTFGNLCHDGWPATATPPQATGVHDIGYTQENENGDLRRLDYMCLSRSQAAPAAHQIWIAFRPHKTIADHWALMTMLHAPAPHCMPSASFNISAQSPVATEPGGKRLWKSTASIVDQDMCWWAYVREPGAYAIFADPSVETHVFTRSDLSRSLADSGRINSGAIPASFADELASFGTGTKYTAPDAFFIRVRGSSASFTGQAAIAVAEMP
jgi:exonuclease III